MKKILSILFLLFIIFNSESPAHSKGPANFTEASNLVERVTPQVKDLVKFERSNDKESSISISKHGDGILIKAENIRQAIAGYGWYLKNIAKVHFSWNGNRLEMPIPMPAPEKELSVKEPWKVNFAYNYCTLSYTMAFWSWTQWEKEIDRLALNGFTHALVTAGLEKVWQNFLKDLQYPEQEIKDFIPSPAYAAWWNMGNLEGFGGPLTQHLIDQETRLGKQIASRMKALGLTPTLQGYVGFIPSDFDAHVSVENLAIVKQGNWCGFKRPSIIDPTCKAFPDIAEKWYKALHAVYGTTTKAYGGDLFHEGGKKGNINVTEAARAVQKSMLEASPDSTWVIMSWYNNPTKELLLGTNLQNTLILQLNKNMHQGGKNLRTYEGRPWVWCEVGNFGANTGLYSGLPMMSKLGSDLLKYKSTGLCGMGLLSEGVELNPLHYELFFDRLWNLEDINLDEWLKEYAVKRYGISSPEIQKALKILEQSIFNPQKIQEGCVESIICARPGWNVKKASTWGPGNRYYSLDSIAKAANLYMVAAKNNKGLLNQDTFLYDLVDITRQYLADALYYQLKIIKNAFDIQNAEIYQKEVTTFMDMVANLRDILSSHPQFTIKPWLSAAKNKGHSVEEKKLMEISAKRLITTWTDKAPQELNDYSNRQWAELVENYYKPRWDIFFNEQFLAIQKRKTPKQASSDALKKITELELKFPQTEIKYLYNPDSDILKSSELAINKLNKKLSDWTDEKSFTKGLGWDLKQGSPLTFNVTDIVLSNGQYVAKIEWEKGQSALKIHSVKLYEGDKEVASDIHEGWTGVENKNNVYILNLKQYREALDAYTLKVEVEGASGTDSSGTMEFRKAN